MSAITQIPAEKGRKNKIDIFSNDPDIYWKQTDACAGFTVSEDCHLREQEMLLVRYQPYECKNNPDLKNKCEQLYAYARFDTKVASQETSQSEFFITIFTCVIMCIGSVKMTDNVDTVIILPVTKMVGIIKLLADDPL